MKLKPIEPIDFTGSPEYGLSLEKQYVKNCMRQYSVLLASHTETPRLKHATTSAEYRKRGNDIYTARNHDADKHREIWNCYTKSVTHAPTDSEELALAYGNRSALLHHFKEYEECVRDCDRGIAASGNNNDFLKTKLMFRKIECLVALKHEGTKKACEEASELLKRFDLNADVKQKFIDKIGEIFKSLKAAKAVKGKKVEKKQQQQQQQQETALSMTRQSEASCASSALAIKHDDTWGRHVVATRRIEPGEVLVVEKSYLTSVGASGAYAFCDHCAKQTWSSLPCDGCVFSVYCSERCKQDAWRASHRYECRLLSLLYNLKASAYPFVSAYSEEVRRSYVRALAAAMRLVMKARDEQGGIEGLRREMKKIQDCTVARTKGFSDSDTVDSDKCRFIFSLTTCADILDNSSLAVFVELACIGTYHLARETDFFGEKLNLSARDMIDNADVEFISAMILKSLLLLPVNALKFIAYKPSNGVGQNYGATLHAFCSLFNHSCDPNVATFVTKDNERVVYAKHVIESGKQLFLCYTGNNYISHSKAERKRILLHAYKITCSCEACTLDWPTVSIYVNDIFKNSPQLKLSLGGHKIKTLEKLKSQVMTALQNSNYKYDPAVLKNVKRLMKEHAESITQRSMDYQTFEHYLHRLLVSAHGCQLNFPDAC